jgi:hypothetical protein
MGRARVTPCVAGRGTWGIEGATGVGRGIVVSGIEIRSRPARGLVVGYVVQNATGRTRGYSVRSLDGCGDRGSLLWHVACRVRGIAVNAIHEMLRPGQVEDGIGCERSLHGDVFHACRKRPGSGSRQQATEMAGLDEKARPITS